MSRVLACPIAVLIVLATGWVHGDRTGRWRVDDSLENAVARLDRIPKDFGAWRGEDQPLDPRQLQAGEVIGAVSRAYVHERDGRHFQVVVLCGRPGPIAVHTPEVCYDANGHVAVTMPTVENVPLAEDARAEWRVVVFRSKRTDAAETLRIAWAWSAGGTWSAPDNPRVTYASQRFLYKVYVMGREWPGDDGARDMLAFAREWLPTLDEALGLQVVSSTAGRGPRKRP